MTATPQPYAPQRRGGIGCRPKAIEHCDDAVAMVADGQHVATGGECPLGPLDDATDGSRPRHRQIVGENDTLKT